MLCRDFRCGRRIHDPKLTRVARAGRSVVTALLLAIGSPAQSEPALLLRISTENTAEHVQTRMVGEFARRLQARAGERLEVRHHYGAALFRDRDVIGALATGKVEMAVPGTWQIDRYEPLMGLLMLPMSFGADVETHHRLRDGIVGDRINDRLADSLDVRVVGRWLDLGHAHLYFTGQPVEESAQIDGLTIRIPGGEANAARLRAIGARPRVVPWPDLPEVLRSGHVDGVLSTHATVASAHLWQYGIRYALETRDYFPQYLPLIARSFWRRLPADLQDLVRGAWDSIVDEARVAAAEAQQDARRTLERNGVTVLEPEPRALLAWRQRLMASQADLVGQLGLPAELVELAATELGRLP